MATVFVVKNRAPHGRKPFFADEEPEFTAIPKECALLLTKQYYTITSFPDQDKKDDSCLTVRSVCCLPRNKPKPAGVDLSDLRHPRTWFLNGEFDSIARLLFLRMLVSSAPTAQKHGVLILFS